MFKYDLSRQFFFYFVIHEGNENYGKHLGLVQKWFELLTPTTLTTPRFTVSKQLQQKSPLSLSVSF